MTDDPLSVSLSIEHAMIDPYIDPTTGVLRNKMGITHLDDLKEAEALLVQAHYYDAFKNTKHSLSYEWKFYQKTNFFNKSITYIWKIPHNHFFSKLYDWAGSFRTISIGRPDEKPCFNASPETLEAECAAALVAALTDEAFGANMAHHYAEMNFQHPFREGNGRTLKVLFTALADLKGTVIDWSRTDRDTYEAALRHWNRTAGTGPLDQVLRGCVVNAEAS